MSIRRLLPAALAALALGAAAGPVQAAAPLSGSALTGVRSAVQAFVAPVAPEYAAGVRVRRAAVSSRDRRFAAAWIDLPAAGRQVAYLRRGAGIWRVLDIGPARVGCGLVPDAALRDLGGRCPGGV